MGNVVLRCLVFVVGLLTALPGWCCLPGPRAGCCLPEPAKAEPVESRSPCCHGQSKHPKPFDLPAPRSEACCCDAPETTKPSLPQTIDIDLACLELIDTVPRTQVPITSFDVGIEDSLQTLPLHVRHCLWLC
jgi:hypothetical protein